jgi:hypothetical protein
MSELKVASQSATSSPLRRFIQRHPLIAFFVIAFAGARIISLPFLLARNGLGPLPFTLPMHVLPGLDLLTIASFTGPTLAAILVTAATSGSVGLRQLLGRIVQWRVGVGWYLLALLGYPLIYVGIYSITLSTFTRPFWFWSRSPRESSLGTDCNDQRTRWPLQAGPASFQTTHNGSLPVGNGATTSRWG